jgi:hypothetical protein
MKPKTVWRTTRFKNGASYALMMEFDKNDENTHYTLAIVERSNRDRDRWIISVLCAESFHSEITYSTAKEARRAAKELFLDSLWI